MRPAKAKSLLDLPERHPCDSGDLLQTVLKLLHGNNQLFRSEVAFVVTALPSETNSSCEDDVRQLRVVEGKVELLQEVSGEVAYFDSKQVDVFAGYRKQFNKQRLNSLSVRRFQSRYCYLLRCGVVSAPVM